VVAQKAADFAAEILRVSADPGGRREIERVARETALQFDWSRIGERQEQIYGKVS
jgi:hypothetical protein